MSVSGGKALFGECKWRNEKVGRQVIDTLLEQGEMFQYPEKYYYIFSKSGFQAAALDYAAQSGRVHLISFEEMYR